MMDDHLIELLRELGETINESLSDSDKIDDAISKIKKAGYDVFLVLEATVGFNKRPENPNESASNLGTSIRSADGRPGLDLTAQDKAFCKALKITIEEDPQ